MRRRPSIQPADAKTTDYEYLATSKALVTEKAAGTVTKTYQYAPTGERLDQIVHNTDGTETPSYYSYNPHTDVEAITGSGGNTKATYGYTAYGQDDTSQDTGLDKGAGAGAADGKPADPYNVYRFNHDRIDGTTATYDMGFRNYDPGLNSFLTRDMYSGAFADTAMTTDPYTGNRYTFAGGNPLSNIELDGHQYDYDTGHPGEPGPGEPGAAPAPAAPTGPADNTTYHNQAVAYTAYWSALRFPDR